MTTIITANVVAQFTSSSSAGGILQAEIDSRPDGFNNGKTSFFPGDDFYFLVYKSTDVSIVSTGSSAGSISGAGSGTISFTEFITFANELEASVTKPITNITATNWAGNNLGTVSAVGGTTLRAANLGIGYLRITYSAAYTAYRVSNIPSNPFGDGGDYGVVAVVTGEHP